MSQGVLIALDWGTTNVRAALFDINGTVLEERRGESGVGQFSKQQFGDHFEILTKGWPKVPAIAAGMVGSRQGWSEAEYLAVPCDTQALSKALVSFQHEGQSITIVPGLKLDNGSRFDVMRGEETQLAGFLTSHTGFTGTIIMPGTHSKWVSLVDGRIVNFQTYMTGEFFDAVSSHTILSHSVSDNTGPDSVFAKKTKDLAAGSGSIEGELFGLRARHLLEGCHEGHLRQELSALLIMAELRAGQQDGFKLDEDTTLIGTETLTVFYETALAALGHSPQKHRGTKLVWPALRDLAIKAKLIEGCCA